MGRPTEPGLVAPPTSVEVTTGAVSVRPYPSKTGTPSSANRASVPAGSGAAPDSASRTDANPSRTSGCSAQAWYIVGAPGTLVTRCRAISASVSAGSNRSTSTALAPAQAVM